MNTDTELFSLNLHSMPHGEHVKVLYYRCNDHGLPMSREIHLSVQTIIGGNVDDDSGTWYKLLDAIEAHGWVIDYSEDGQYLWVTNR